MLQGFAVITSLTLLAMWSPFVVGASLPDRPQAKPGKSSCADGGHRRADQGAGALVAQHVRGRALGSSGLQGRRQPYVRLDVSRRSEEVLLTVKLTPEEREAALS